MKHAKLSAVSLAAALVVFPMIGCEKMESSAAQKDRDVQAALATAQQDKEQGGKAAEKAIDDLKRAAAISDASPVGQTAAKSALAREEFERALARMPEIARRTQEIDIALWGLESAGAQIRAAQGTATAYQKLEPTEALDQLKKSRDEIKAPEGKTPEEVKATRVGKAQSEAAEAKKELDERQKEIDGLKAQRTVAENEADQLAQKSSEAKGKESVDLYRQSTEARIKAGTLAAQIESKTAALMPIQRKMAIAEQQVQFWDSTNKDNPGALQQLEERQAQIKAGWEATQGDVKAINDLATKIAGNVLTPKSANNHDNTAATLVKLVGENNELRAQVGQDLTDAIKNFDEAATAAKKAREAVTERMSALEGKSRNDSGIETLRSLAAAYEESNYLLAKGHAETALASLQTDTLRELSMRATIGQELSNALKGSGLSLNADLAKALATPQDVQAARSKAEATYAEAEKTLDAVASVDRNGLDIATTKNAGLLGLIGARYGHYVLTDDAKIKESLKGDIAKAKANEPPLELPAAVRSLQ